MMNVPLLNNDRKSMQIIIQNNTITTIMTPLNVKTAHNTVRQAFFALVRAPVEATLIREIQVDNAENSG